MKIIIHRLGSIFGHDLLELLQGGGLDGLHRLKMLQQLLAALLPHSGYLVQNGGLYVSPLELTVVFDGEAPFKTSVSFKEGLPEILLP